VSLVLLNLILSFISALVLHELGHLLAACAFKISVKEVGFGWGPKVFLRRLAELEFTLRALPIGAYIRMDMSALQQRPLFQQVVVLLAGIVTNLLLGIICWGTFFGSFNLALAFANLLPIYQQDGWKCGLLVFRRLFGRPVPLVEWSFTIAGALLAVLLVLLAVAF
jgi:membrane-associated protease RseP (regulator of RpoE activity)